jgi:hypothetical protein
MGIHLISDQAGVVFEPAELQAALDRLWRTGLVIRSDRPSTKAVRVLDSWEWPGQPGFLISPSGARTFLAGGASDPLDD